MRCCAVLYAVHLHTPNAITGVIVITIFHFEACGIRAPKIQTESNAMHSRCVHKKAEIPQISHTAHQQMFVVVATAVVHYCFSTIARIRSTFECECEHNFLLKYKQEQ